MDESVAAQQVWRYLQGLGCTRVTGRTQLYGSELHFVEIYQGGNLIASGEHAVQTLANSGALLEAMRRLGPRSPDQGAVAGRLHSCRSNGTVPAH